MTDNPNGCYNVSVDFLTLPFPLQLNVMIMTNNLLWGENREIDLFGFNFALQLCYILCHAPLHLCVERKHVTSCPTSQNCTLCNADVKLPLQLRDINFYNFTYSFRDI
ncbi:hypothetical protein X798_00591 [Onchocerca flexuosa]|uniref:Transmembrane protein n=2 Tax=Onchocerca flexuosa TaxID=387005 RepID=A0A183GXV1_9BILA|nr:hypothetical protein X798_00591 [Onchocerca flexuosa]VDO24369.1 unnamed protein product [Onchocerca flexuosa]